MPLLLLLLLLPFGPAMMMLAIRSSAPERPPTDPLADDRVLSDGATGLAARLSAGGRMPLPLPRILPPPRIRPDMT